MSDRWWLYRGGNQIQWNRNDEPLPLLTLFTEAEKVVDQAWLEACERQTSLVYFPDDVDLQEADAILLEDVDPAGAFGYRAKVSTVRRRLSLMGFTPEACRRELSRGIYEAIEEDQLGDSISILGVDGVVCTIPKEEVLDRALQAYEAGQSGPPNDPVEEYCAGYIELFVESGVDRRVVLALQLEYADPGDEVWLDLHDLYFAGYFEGVDNITQLAVDELAANVSSGGPIVVVTEGVTDAEFLKCALDLVAPQLSHMFRFFDRDAGAELNAAQVVRTLRAFAAAGITNRVVGVLDNDAAGRAAARDLEAKPRPTNNRYFLLPDVPYGKSYPTIGPSGVSDLDINGRAAAIEFQFGLDVLRTEGGELAKVEWSGPVASIGVYQGSLSNADKIHAQKNIRSFLASASPDHEVNEEPWTTIHALVASLLKAAEPESFPGQLYTQWR